MHLPMRRVDLLQLVRHHACLGTPTNLDEEEPVSPILPMATLPDVDEEDVVVRDLADFEGPSTAIGSLAPGAPGPSGLPPRRRGNVTLEETDSETDTEYDMW